MPASQDIIKLHSPTFAVAQTLFDVFGTPLVDQLTALADTAGGPGLILNVPQTNFEVFAPGDVLPGAYNVGIACTLGAPSATQLDRYWNLKMTVSSNPVGGAAQVTTESSLEAAFDSEVRFENGSVVKRDDGTFVVNGRYLVNNSAVGSWNGIRQLIDFLVAQERARLKK